MEEKKVTFFIKLSNNIDVIKLTAPFLFKYDIYTYDPAKKKEKRKQSVNNWQEELNDIPHKVDIIC